MWVKLTDEAFPRLSIVREVRDDGAHYIGPFRSRRSAEAAVARRPRGRAAAPVHRRLSPARPVERLRAGRHGPVRRAVHRGARASQDYAVVVAEAAALSPATPATR